MHCYVEKQVFSWCDKKVPFFCIISWKSRFFHAQPKTKCIFDALLRFKAGFLMMRQKLLYLMHFYVEKQVFSWRDRKQSVYKMHYYVSKQVFSWRAKNSYIWCIVTWKNRFSHDAPKRCKFVALLRGKAGFLMTWPKTKCIQDALLRFKAGFLMTRQILLYLMHYYMEKQVFSWRAKKVQICCLITWKSRFSHDAPKILIFDTLLHGKAVFLMMRQKGANLLHYYVESRFSHDVTENKVYTRCIIMFQSRFSHYVLKTFISDALLLGKAGSIMTLQKGANLLHYYVEKQVFSWGAKMFIFDVLIRGKAGFLVTRPKAKCIFDVLLCFLARFFMTHQKLLYLMH